MQKFDKKLWDEALIMLKKLKVSEKCLNVLKSLIGIRGRKIEAILSEVKDKIRDYENSVLAVENLEDILNLTFEGGVKFEISVEPGFARGLEYYTGMIFEVFVPELDIALGGGGRYDKLIELFGGEPTPAVGVAHGIDRITLAMEKQNTKPKLPREPLVVIVPVDNSLRPKALELATKLREGGISVEVEVMGRSVSRALQDADRRGATYTVLIAPQELKEGKVVLRNMQLREQKTVNVDRLASEILGE
jgi:histidyl-tRNA synthetase